MVINENNSQINSFTKGMNSDSAYDQVENTQYTFGKNMRITKNYLLNKMSSNEAHYKEGSITPIYEGKDASSSYSINLSSYNILAVDSIDDIGVIVATCNHKLYVYRLILDRDNNTITKFEKWFQSDTLSKDITSASVVLYRELENVIKLYIATGEYPIMSIRIDNLHGQYGDDDYNIDYTINNRVFPTDVVYIEKVIGGSLKTSQVQYTYRYYNKYGPASRLAPLTNKIQVISPNRNNEIGNAEDTKTSIGFALRINVPYEHRNHYERLQIFRLSYIKPDEDAEVCLIYDDKLEVIDNQFAYNDVGNEPLRYLNIEEFASLAGIIIHPYVIENNQDYMFAANVVDDTIIKGLEIKSDPTPQLVTSTINISKYYSDKKYALPNVDNLDFTYSNGLLSNGINVPDYFKDRNINPNEAKDTYNNIFTSSLLRSLRRGETYKYGIVFYDKYGRRSDVKNLGDIEVPQHTSDTTQNYRITSTTFDTGINNHVFPDTTLYAHPIGVKFQIPMINKPDIIGCQIVRRSSKDIYQKTLLQVALARPLNQVLWPYHVTTSEIESGHAQPTQSPYYPLGFLTSDYVRVTPSYYDQADEEDISKYSPVYSVFNKGLFQAFSSEIDFRRDDVLNKISKYQLELQPIRAISTLVGRTPTRDDARDYKQLNSQIYSQCKKYLDNDSQYVSGQGSVSRNGGQKFKVVYNKERGNYRPGTIQNPTVLPRYCETQWTEPYQLKNDSEFDQFLLDITGKFQTRFVHYMSWISSLLPDDPKDSNYVLEMIQAAGDKIADNVVFNYYEWNVAIQNTIGSKESYKIESIKDVRIPKWHEGFSNIEFDGSDIVAGIKQYKSYTTSIGRYKYNNWASMGMYDLKIWQELQPNVNDRTTQFLSGDQPRDRDEIGSLQMFGGSDASQEELSKGYIGPGPSCFLVQINEEKMASGNPYVDLISYRPLGTYVCNITHDISFSSVESDEQVQYFGFGNFFKLEYAGTQPGGYIYNVVHGNGTRDRYATVFDGDIYITPHELVTMRKAYDFNSYDTLQSFQVVNYVPLESKVNTFFDYGMNFLNTNSPNMMLDGGGIDGVISQERPEHQYNMIYSSNDVSNDVFSRIYTDETETNNFPYRTYFSEPKINGEFIDNFLIHKAASFIDVDNKYGEITELMTNKNTLYYWQLRAFGKFSVNERSLINDTNGNTIMLGQAGILSRYDYVDTKFGMRKYDFCAVGVDNNVYWIDINNKAVVASDGQSAVNYSERNNVQNIVNKNISTNIPRIDYDVQNQELLCKCLNNQEQLIFNLKYNIATSVYNRNYIDILHIYNHIYGFYLNNGIAKFRKYNYLKVEDVINTKHLTPLYVEFLVNKSASSDKVYDSQTIIPEKRNPYDGSDSDPIESTYMKNLTLSFETDIIDTNTNQIEGHTDREGNIIYNVPRYGSKEYGNRMRGKWMRTTINKVNPDDSFTISHVITKLRQSFS